MTIEINSRGKSYPVIIESGALSDVKRHISPVFDGRRITVISDDNVFPLYGEKLIRSLLPYECSCVVLPHGERAKSLESLPAIYSAMAAHNMTRSGLVIALGGGVVGDIAGFAASTFLRGINLVQIPTSLLSQVDSCIGGKTALDLPSGKNLVGTFYDPKAVIIDPAALLTLPERFIKDGMAEVIKYACAFDAELAALLLKSGSFENLKPFIEEAVSRCIGLKRRAVEKDPFDLGGRMLLNFGHTLGHAVEQYLGYEGMTHGEAVAVGMYQITKISEKTGLTEKGTAEKLRGLLMAYGLPSQCGISLGSLKKAILLDKKNLNGSLNLILLRKMGEAFIYPSNPDFFKDGGVI